MARSRIVRSCYDTVPTFASTIQIRLSGALRIIGRPHVNLRFFVRYATVLQDGSWALSTGRAADCRAGACNARPVSGEVLVPYVEDFNVLPLGVAFVVLYVLAMRYLRLFNHEDAVEFRDMEIRSLDRLLDLVVGKQQE